MHHFILGMTLLFLVKYAGERILKEGVVVAKLLAAIVELIRVSYLEQWLGNLCTELRGSQNIIGDRRNLISTSG